MKKTNLEDMHFGHSVKVLQLSDKFIKQKNNIPVQLKLPLKNQFSHFFVFNKNSKHLSFGMESNKKHFMDQVNQIIIKQKFNLKLPAIYEDSTKADKRVSTEDSMSSPRNDKSQVNTLNVNTEDEFDDFDHLKAQNSEDLKFDYINNIDNGREFFKGGNAHIANDKFKRLKKKLKISSDINDFRIGRDKDYNQHNNNCIVTAGPCSKEIVFEIKDIGDEDDINSSKISLLRKSRNKRFNGGKVLHRNHSIGSLNQNQGGKNNINTENRNPFAYAKNKNMSVNDGLKDALVKVPLNLKRDYLSLPKIETKQAKKPLVLSDKVRMRHLIAKQSKLNNILNKDHSLSNA